MRTSRFLTAAAVVAAALAGAVQAGTAASVRSADTPPFNLEVILRASDGGDGFGHVEFRQPDDGVKIVYLDTWVRDLAPDHDYLLQRAVDPTPDGDCTGTTWLTLGEGSTPQAITTNDKATGREDLFRDLTAVPTGSQFDIQFRLLDAATSAVVLESGCYQYTVRGT